MQNPVVGIASGATCCKLWPTHAGHHFEEDLEENAWVERPLPSQNMFDPCLKPGIRPIQKCIGRNLCLGREVEKF